MLVHGVNLNYRTVRIVGKALAFGGKILYFGNRFVDVFYNGIAFAYLKAVIVQHGKAGGMFILMPCAHAVGKKAQLAACRYFGVKLAQAARRRVARIGKFVFTRFAALLVQLHKSVAGHVNLTAHIQKLRYFFAFLNVQRQRNGTDSAHIGGYVFTNFTVAACCGTYQTAVFVNEAAGKAVNFRFKNIFHLAAFGQAAFYTRVKRSKFFVAEGVAQRKQRRHMAHFGKLRAYLAANPARRRIRRHIVRICTLNLLQAAH